jgi:ferredoxin
MRIGPEVPSPSPDPPLPFAVRFEADERSFTAAADETLVAAAARAGIELPTSCRNGTCRTCMCQVRSGEIAYRIQWPGLLAEEKAEGWILPCIAYARSDLLLEQPHRR